MGTGLVYRSLLSDLFHHTAEVLGVGNNFYIERFVLNPVRMLAGVWKIG